jgi:hypothetical protein
MSLNANEIWGSPQNHELDLTMNTQMCALSQAKLWTKLRFMVSHFYFYNMQKATIDSTIYLRLYSFEIVKLDFYNDSFVFVPCVPSSLMSFDVVFKNSRRKPRGHYFVLITNCITVLSKESLPPPTRWLFSNCVRSGCCHGGREQLTKLHGSLVVLLFLLLSN